MRKIVLTAILGVTFSTTLFANTNEWVEFSNDEYTDEKSGLKSTYRYEIIKSDFSKEKFNKPFLVKSRLTYTSGHPDKLFDTVTTTESFIDCKNMRFAEANSQYLSYGIDAEKSSKDKIVVKADRKNEVRFDKVKPIPDKEWKSFDSRSEIHGLTCKYTQGYSPDNSSNNNYQPDWKLVRQTKGPAFYLNKSDIATATLDKPFVVRTKAFSVKGDRTVNDKPYTSIVTHGVIDCKNMKNVVLKNVYYSNDYEFVSNNSPNVVYTQTMFKNISAVPEKSWSSINEDLVKDVGLCTNKD